MITQGHIQESLSLAYVHALAGRAGLNLQSKTNFDYGVDGTFMPVVFRGNERIQSGFAVQFQMKASTDWAHDGAYVVYDLDVRAYNLIAERQPYEIPCILILLCLPKDASEWLVPSETEMYLRHCCYWYRVTGAPTTNTSTQRIRIPRENVLTPDSLSSMMKAMRQEAMEAR